MKKILILITVLFLLGSISALGQKKDFIEEYTYTAGDRDSKNVCYDIAKTQLRSILLDKVGVYVRSERMLKTTEANGKYDQNFIENITTTNAGITNFTVLDQKWDGIKYWMKALMTVDTTSLKELVANKQKSDELTELKLQVQSIRSELDMVKGSKLNVSTQNKVTSEGNQRHTKQVLTAGRNEQFISLKQSSQTNNLFLTTTRGRMIVLDNKDSIIKIVQFKTLGEVFLDNNGSMGAYSDENHVIHFFDQKTLKLTDTVTVSKVKGYGSYNVWFTKTGRIFMSSPKNVYRYGLDKTIQIVAPSYSILDYSNGTDQFLLGYWDNALNGDRKIKKLSLCDATNIEGKKQVLVLNSFEVYSYFMDNGGMIISYDGKGNYYKFNVYSWQKSILLQDTIRNEKRRIFGLSKIDENVVMVVKNYPFEMNPENVKKYEIKFGDIPTEFLFKKIKGDEIVRSILLLQPVSGTNIVVNTTTKTIYYLSTGLSNKLIAIK